MIAVVYLVWGPQGPGRAHDFVTSYQEYHSGADHDLIIVYNSVRDDQRSGFDAEFSSIDHRVVELRAPMLDLAAYLTIADSLPHERLCFLNSYSVILAPQWLAKLDSALTKPGIGLVGATGSWFSRRSSRLNSLSLPSMYRGALPPGRWWKFSALEGALSAERNGNRWPAGQRQIPPESGVTGPLHFFLSALRELARTPKVLRRFEPFPAHHVRTNAFMMRRAMVLRLRIASLKRKLDTYVLESGRDSITQQVEQQGSSVLVVARDGTVYDPDRWPLSDTFWQGQQDSLLVGDNQTRLYERATFEQRHFLSALAWGWEARPEARDDAPRRNTN